MTKRSPVLCLFVISGFCFFTGVSSLFHIIELLKNYEDAKSYCREMYTDLGTVRNLADMNDLVTAAASATTVRAWIGLENGAVWKWHWTLPEHQLVYSNWSEGEPQIKNQDACAAMDEHGKWFESDCGDKRGFVCHGNGGSTGHIFVADLTSWRAAQNHCRGLSSDLVSISSAEVNEAVLRVSLSQKVWIGLFKDPWIWSDGSSSSFRNWKPDQPNYRKDQNCVVAVFNDGGEWNDLKCQGARKFVCQGVSPLTSTTTQTTTETTTTTQLSTTTTTEVTSTTTQTTTQKTTTVQMSTSTTTIETTPTTQPNTTTLTTELITPNTTYTAYSTLSTTLSNVTTDAISASTTPMGTSAQNTTQLSYPTSTETSPSPPAGNLILIQQSMTWIEAMGYCREHHNDLVHITTEDIQEKVAEKAKNATSPYVWLGIRYTCNFDFWFWTKSTSGCYQNWAPGEGTDGTYDCGVTGAIQATGGQQWVGLPETEKLNFICSTCPD
ncbi:uncharacterized protein LOC131471352 [Solea solea]|uniref:uncharacterized protein LOC131471352 n=1 Tax=Solea solea TaxID=90069 RepID=UPI00272B7BF3|nr:uncharacterized protein LOC131471352 [Solea solea]